MLHDLYACVAIPSAVSDELRVGSGRPGEGAAADALEQGWLQIRELSAGSARSLSELVLILDRGEAEAILLAKEVDARFLLIDERMGRAIAKRRGVPVVGAAGVLLVAKKRGLIDAVLPVLKKIELAGYRMSAGLTREIARLAGEDG